MSAAQILAGEKGAALHEELVGVAVGFDEDGELETAAAILRREQVGRSH